MRIQITLNLFLCALFAVKVQGTQELEACPRKEASPGVLALTLGREVILGCRGDVTVDGVLIATVTKHQGRVRRRTAVIPQIDEDISDTTGYYWNISDVSIRGTYHNITSTRIHGKDKSETKTTANPPITTEKQMRTGHFLHAISLPFQQKRVGGDTEEREAFKVTMEMGGKEYEENINVEYKQYEGYSDQEDELRVTRAISRRAHWTRNGQSVQGGVEKGGALRLPTLQLKDSGNYSCFRGGRLISSVNISVGVPPERPALKCYKKFHTSKIRCEWVSKQPVIPQPHCYLLLRKGWDESSLRPCSYSTERSRCWCALPGEEADRNVYVAKLCVANTVGSATSDPLRYIPPDIIKPDPPARVAVREVPGQFQTLHVSWSYPASWRQGFYFLQFQLRYRPLQAIEYQLVDIDGAELFWLILDAMPHTQYEVQLRAKDEFDGLWSDWTSPVYAHTWTAPEPTIPSNFYTSMESFWTFPEGSGGSETDSVVVVDGESAADSDAVLWVYVLWVFGLCVFVSFTMLSVYSLRHRVPLMFKNGKQGCYPSTPPPPLFQQLVVAPHQQSQHHFLPEKEEEGIIHLHNVDYFLCPGD